MRENKDQLPGEEEENKEQVPCKKRQEPKHANKVEIPLEPVCTTSKKKAKAARKSKAKKEGKKLVNTYKENLIEAIKCEGPCGKKKKRECVKPRKKDIKPTEKEITLRAKLLTDAKKEELNLGECTGNKAWFGVTAVISFKMTGNCRCIKKKKKKKK